MFHSLITFFVGASKHGTKPEFYDASNTLMWHAISKTNTCITNREYLTNCCIRPT